MDLDNSNAEGGGDFSWVREALDSIRSDYSRAIVLVDMQNHTYSEAAKVLDIQMPLLKTWVHRGRKELREKLSEQMNQIPA